MLTHLYHSNYCKPLKSPSLWRGGRGYMKKDKLPKITIRGEYYGNRTLPSLNDYLEAIAKHPKQGNKFKQDYQKPIKLSTFLY